MTLQNKMNNSLELMSAYFQCEIEQVEVKNSVVEVTKKDGTKELYEAAQILRFMRYLENMGGK